MALSRERLEELLGIALASLGTVVILSIWLYPWVLRGLPKNIEYSPTTTDALWFTLQTITTTGYGSLPQEVWDNAPQLKWFSMALMVVVVPAWSVFLGIAVNLVSERR